MNAKLEGELKKLFGERGEMLGGDRVKTVDDTAKLEFQTDLPNLHSGEVQYKGKLIEVLELPTIYLGLIREGVGVFASYQIIRHELWP